MKRKLTQILYIGIVAMVVMAIAWMVSNAWAMTPSEHFAIQVKKALVTENLVAYDMNYNKGFWDINIFYKDGMTTILVKDGSWPKSGRIWQATIAQAGDEFTVPVARGGSVMWNEDEIAPRKRMYSYCTGAQEFLDKYLAGKAELGPDYGLFEGSRAEFWEKKAKPLLNKYNKPYTPTLSIST